MFNKKQKEETIEFLPKKIGIPRAFSYYNNYPFYYGFFKSLGFEIVISDKTTNKIINDGSAVLVSDSCFPLKVYVGHLLNLLEKGVSTIFVPSLQSVSFKVNNCSKIRGLPEIIRNVVDIPFNMIEPTLDKTEEIGFYDFWEETLKPFGITDKEVVKQATKAGWEMYDNFLEMTHNGIDYKLALSTAYKKMYGKQNVKVTIDENTGEVIEPSDKEKKKIAEFQLLFFLLFYNYQQILL